MEHGASNWTGPERILRSHYSVRNFCCMGCSHSEHSRTHGRSQRIFAHASSPLVSLLLYLVYKRFTCN